MKRPILLCFTLISLVLCLNITGFASSVKMGDIDGDGKLSAKDARLALRASVELEEFSDAQFFIADVDNNKKITAADARKI